MALSKEYVRITCKRCGNNKITMKAQYAPPGNEVKTCDRCEHKEKVQDPAFMAELEAKNAAATAKNAAGK